MIKLSKQSFSSAAIFVRLPAHRDMAPLARSAGLLALLLVSFCPCSSEKDTRYDSFHVVSEINARFSTTRVRSVLSNLGNDSKELTFTFQLPETALISGFTM